MLGNEDATVFGKGKTMKRVLSFLLVLVDRLIQDRKPLFVLRKGFFELGGNGPDILVTDLFFICISNRNS